VVGVVGAKGRQGIEEGKANSTGLESLARGRRRKSFRGVGVTHNIHPYEKKTGYGRETGGKRPRGERKEEKGRWKKPGPSRKSGQEKKGGQKTVGKKELFEKRTRKDPLKDLHWKGKEG